LQRSTVIKIVGGDFGDLKHGFKQKQNGQLFLSSSSGMYFWRIHQVLFCIIYDFI